MAQAPSKFGATLEGTIQVARQMPVDTKLAVTFEQTEYFDERGIRRWSYQDRIDDQPATPVLASAKPIVDWIICLLLAQPPGDGGSALYSASGGSYQVNYLASNPQLGFSLTGVARSTAGETTGKFQAIFEHEPPKMGPKFHVAAHLTPIDAGIASINGLIHRLGPKGQPTRTEVTSDFDFTPKQKLAQSYAIVRVARYLDPDLRQGYYQEQAI